MVDWPLPIKAKPSKNGNIGTASANQSFFHFVIPTELWFATDRDINSAGVPVPAKTRRGKAKN
jgi:hypothetical protein